MLVLGRFCNFALCHCCPTPRAASAEPTICRPPPNRQIANLVQEDLNTIKPRTEANVAKFVSLPVPGPQSAQRMERTTKLGILRIKPCFFRYGPPNLTGVLAENVRCSTRSRCRPCASVWGVPARIWNTLTPPGAHAENAKPTQGNLTLTSITPLLTPGACSILHNSPPWQQEPNAETLAAMQHMLGPPPAVHLSPVS